MRAVLVLDFPHPIPSFKHIPTQTTDTMNVDVATVGTHPSFRFEGADVVLRSCDGIEFKVHSGLLEMISPVLQGLFTMPRDAQETRTTPIQMGSGRTR